MEKTTEKHAFLQAVLFTQSPQEEQTLRIKEALDSLSQEFPHELTLVEVGRSHYLREIVTPDKPLLEIGPYQVKNPQDRDEIRQVLSQAYFRKEQALSRADGLVLKQLVEKPSMSSASKLALWFSRHYLAFFNILVLIYVALPFLAPILTKTGFLSAGQRIYDTYQYFCHQLPYRSFFLFGEQLVYPRALAGLEGLKTFEEASGLIALEVDQARRFIGTESMGYKISLCQRDLAIYVSILLFGLVFALSNRRIKPLPWFFWILFGLVPIGLDGFSQMISQMQLSFLSWLPVRESTPFLRVLTGALFGAFTAWFGYPSFEESFLPVRLELEKKFAYTKAVNRN